MLGRIRKLANAFRKTPLHPQWFAFLREERNLAKTCQPLHGTVLDVGCADGSPKKYLSPHATYVGLDYFSTATDWYGTRPDIYGDAQSLPLRDGSVDHALLLDVLEHLPNPERCLVELHRVIKQGGSLTIQVPFIYPLHDAPLDFHRWTRYGLRQSARRSGFRIDVESAIGHPLETAALSANIAMTQSVINWIQGKNPLALFALLLPLGVLLTNTGAWVFAALSRDEDLMPYAYRMIWTKD
jgi:SAM-dependent methyltransferase